MHNLCTVIFIKLPLAKVSHFTHFCPLQRFFFFCLFCFVLFCFVFFFTLPNTFTIRYFLHVQEKSWRQKYKLTLLRLTFPLLSMCIAIHSILYLFILFFIVTDTKYKLMSINTYKYKVDGFYIEPCAEMN